MNGTPAPTASIEAALAHARRLLDAQQPALAAEQAQEILRAVPGHPIAALLHGAALRACGRIGEALRVLGALAEQQPRAAAAHYEFGLALAEAGEAQSALASLRRALDLKPDLPDTWRALGDQLSAAGDREAADAAFAQHIRASTTDPRLLAPAAALCENRIPEAETLLRAHLRGHPTDVAAIRMLAEVAGRLGRYADAEDLLSRCLELAPGFNAARHNYAIVLNRQHKTLAAMGEIERLLTLEPDNPGYRNLQAVILTKIGDYAQAIEIYSTILAAHPQQFKIWMSYGHALATAGRERDSVAAYRRAIALSGSCGEAYWSLANLKTFRFSGEELAAMRAQLAGRNLSDAERWHFHFAAGKALEDQGEYADSFQHYAAGNRLRRASVFYDPDLTSTLVRRSKHTLSAQFFAARAGWGAPDPDPIFIVGLPRAGSTLIEQILSSHSLVEGTAELPDIMSLARSLGGGAKGAGSDRYPEALAALGAEECRALGEEYLRRTHIQRRTGKPRFIDKMPNNCLYLGLIRLALPNAKIIDARRHPMACCFSGFKQLFANGQNYTYSLEEIGRYYRDYTELMSHFDAVQPGSVYRVIYEHLVDATESQVRALLDFCGLPFEESCLRFYETARAVRTASSQQVRQPIFREGVDQWRRFEPWLAPLQRVLAPLIEAYPGDLGFQKADR